MLPRLLRVPALLRPAVSRVSSQSLVARRTMIAAPKMGDAPFMERRANRELPEVESGMKWARSVPIFLIILVSTTLAIFNYQKSSSSVVSSTMYALRTSPKAREYLGDEIYFYSKMPWIWGEMNQLHGRINIHFEVKGKKNSGTMKFTSHRPTRMGMFTTTEWSLTTKDGEKIDLLDGNDPFQGVQLEEEAKQPGRGSYSPHTSS